ncbi:MAG: hypothetical protein Q8Q28_10740 [Pseudomonadota bacterium]|nr:hypothetical protein [Pseudomonadota bacterium]
MNTEMKTNWQRKTLVAGLMALGVGSISFPASASVILSGSDYLHTTYATFPDPIPSLGLGLMHGVPLTTTNYPTFTPILST